jgi:hypothetical protein
MPDPKPKIKLHLKILYDPEPVRGISINKMVENAKTLFVSKGFDFEERRMPLNLPDLLVVEVTPNCPLNILTAEQYELFNNREHVTDDEIVIYFVQADTQSGNGCAAHPSEKPGAIVTSIATGWTLAHEIGHVLKIDHNLYKTRLMYRSTEELILSNSLPPLPKLPKIDSDELEQAKAAANIIFEDIDS